MSEAENKERGERALMAYEAMAFKWVQDHGIDKAIDAIATTSGPTASKAASAIHGLVTQAWIEGADAGFSARKDLSDRYRAQVEELEQLFEMTWAADRRAIESWRAANPGNERVLPDREKLMLWLLSQIPASVQHPCGGDYAP